MANYRAYLHFTMVDTNGNFALTEIPLGIIADSKTLANVKVWSDDINTVLGPLTNTKVVRRSFSFVVDEAQGVGTDAEYPLVSQKATLHFGNAFGSNSSVSLPGPKEAIFLPPPSDDVVDSAQTDMAAFITAYESLAADAGNNLLNLFKGGALSSRRRPRKRSIRT